jgi:hypothetical protein
MAAAVYAVPPRPGTGRRDLPRRAPAKQRFDIPIGGAIGEAEDRLQVSGDHRSGSCIARRRRAA